MEEAEPSSAPGHWLPAQLSAPSLKQRGTREKTCVRFGLTGALIMGWPKLPAQPLWAHTPGAWGLPASWPHLIRQWLQGISVGTARPVQAVPQACVQRNCSLVGQQGAYRPLTRTIPGGHSVHTDTDRADRRRHFPRGPQRDWGSRLQAMGSVAETVAASPPPPTTGCVHSSGCFRGQGRKAGDGEQVFAKYQRSLG